MSDGNGATPEPNQQMEIPAWVLAHFERRFGQLEMQIVGQSIQLQAAQEEIQRLTKEPVDKPATAEPVNQ